MLILVFEIVKNRVLGVLTLVLHTVQVAARVRPAEALPVLRVPIYDRLVRVGTCMAWAEISGNMNGVIG
jgi:hypothetical protein